MQEANRFTAAELFAGVGGFHLGLKRAGWTVVWSNQFEPSTKKHQHAYGCMRYQFGHDDPRLHSNCDVAEIAELLKEDGRALPDMQLLVGGFPCQDYSVAKPRSKAEGLHGRKGVLWWEIEHIVRAKRPRFVLLENVDRLLVSPSTDRGRDFATILACFAALGYSVEWRVVNAADYGEPQRRKRVFIFAEHARWSASPDSICDSQLGVLSRALPCRLKEPGKVRSGRLPGELPVSRTQEAILEYVLRVLQPAFAGRSQSDFANAGVMSGGEWHTASVVVDASADARLHRGAARNAKKRATLGDVLESDAKVLQESPEYFVSAGTIDEWKRLKGPKADERRSGDFAYAYKEGGMPLFDDRNAASRTVITGEGGSTPSRFKHLVEVDPETVPDELQGPLGPFLVRRLRPDEPVRRSSKRPVVRYSEKEMEESIVAGDWVAFRRLTPIELEALNGFPRDWTRWYLDGDGVRQEMSPSRRAFMMGNALVIGVVARIAREIKKRAVEAAEE